MKKIYEVIGKSLYETLQEIDKYVIDAYKNALCNVQIGEKKIKIYYKNTKYGGICRWQKKLL